MKNYSKDQIKLILDDTRKFITLELIKSNKFPNKNGELVTFRGTLNISHKRVHLLIKFDKYFPIHKPIYYIENKQEIGFIAHVSPDGNTCYIKDEGVCFDIDNIEEIITESLTETIRTIKEGIEKTNQQDLLDEFEYYLGLNNNLENIHAISLIKIDDNIKIIDGLENNRIKLFGNNTKEILQYFGFNEGFLLKNNYSKLNAIFIPLDVGSKIYPPKYDEYWGTDEIHKNVFKNISDSKKKRLVSILNQNNKIRQLILGIPQPSGINVLVGVLYYQIRNKKYHPLIHPKNFSKVKLLKINRQDKEFLMPRSGSNLSLSKKRVLIIGCGSLGGYIASEIVKAGILNITLVDDDILTPENCFRHYLGKRYFYKKKANALKDEILANIPYCNIQSISSKIEVAIEKKEIHFEEIDTVIIATGNPSINLYLNDFFITNFKKLPVLYSWNDPYGIGGHTILTNNNNQNGCYRCLYSDLNNTASFAKPNQKFAKSISGCGSLFTPYGSLDSLQTAIITVQLTIDSLLEKENDNPIISWKGDVTAFTENGFELSARYNKSTEELFQLKYEYKNNHCTICNKVN